MGPNRSLVRAAGFAVLAGLGSVLLTGCFTVRMDLEIRSDDTVDGSVVVAVDKGLATLAGGEDELLEGLMGERSLFEDAPTSGTISQREYRTDDKLGVEYQLEGIPIEEFSSGDGELSIVRDGDRFLVSGSLDLSGEVPGGEDATAMLSGAEVEVAVTFPGDVLEANGAVDGRTVTWRPRVGEANPITAVGSADGGSSVLLLGALAAGLGLIAVVLVVVVVRRPRSSAPVAGAEAIPVGSVLPGQPLVPLPGQSSHSEG